MSHDIRPLIHAGRADALREALDAMDHSTRVSVTRALGKADQTALWALAAGNPPLTPQDFARAGTVSAVAHAGTNTLPLPFRHRTFTKWMARTEDGGVGGWNDAPPAWLIGPGFFVLRETIDGEWPDSAVVVDYHRVPRGRLPAGWPRLRPNWFGLQVLIYFHTRDYMRRVSEHVSIGLATKYRRSLGSYFVLVRDDEGAS